MTVPLIFSFWLIVAAYVIHVLDESLLGGSFVEEVRQHWWPDYSWSKFFWFNTGYFIVIIASILLYDFLGGAWVIFPLAWAIERFCNGLWHVWWAIRFREYSPGLLSSLLMWINLYFILRYRPSTPVLSRDVVVPALVIALLWTTFLFFYIPIAKGRSRRPSLSATG